MRRKGGIYGGIQNIVTEVVSFSNGMERGIVARNGPRGGSLWNVNIGSRL